MTGGLGDLSRIFADIINKKGKSVSFSKIDMDHNQEISETEFNNAAKLFNVVNLDSFNGLDTDGNGVISREEFAVIENNRELQKVLNSLGKSLISVEFSGIDSGFIGLAVEGVKKFALEYSGPVEEFAAALEEFFAEMISGPEFQNRPSEILAKKLDEVYEQEVVGNLPQDKLNDGLGEFIFSKLEKAGYNYVKAHVSDPELEEHLVEYLINYVHSNPYEDIKDDVESFKNKIAGYGTNVDSYSELKKLKEDSKILITKLLNNGVEVKLGTTNIKTEVAITSALAKYTSGNKLRDDMLELIDNIPTSPRLEQWEQEYDDMKARQAAAAAQAQAAQEAANQAAEDAMFNNTPGSAYAVNSALIDKTQIDNYSTSTRVNKRNFLMQDAIKNQMKNQIKATMQRLGFSNAKINLVLNVFNAVYTDSVNEMVGDQANDEFNKNIDTTQLLNDFITLFNQKMEAAINEMNQTDLDMDLQDIDAGIVDKYMPGSYETWGDFYRSTDRSIVEGKMKSAMKAVNTQLRIKAQRLCTLHNVEFNRNMFSLIYGNSITETLNTAIVKEGNVYTVHPRQAMHTFLTKFKTDFTAWVNSPIVVEYHGEDYMDYIELEYAYENYNSAATAAAATDYNNDWYM